MIIPEKLKYNDEIRIIAPSRSLKLISEECRDYANRCFAEMGLRVTFSKNCEISDDFMSSSIEERIEDLHEAFTDKNVKCILTVIGGFNSNQLLRYIDYDLIKSNPKILCGYSDITALSNAIYSKTGLVTYSGPHYSTFGMKKGIDYTIEYFKRCFFSKDEYKIEPSKMWSDDLWFLEQEERVFHENNGYKSLGNGRAEGKIIGGNLCTLNLLQGTEFMPDLTDKLLFIEDDGMTSPETFDRDLQSLIHQPNFEKVRGMVFGRFQIESKMEEELFEKIIGTKTELKNMPIIYNADFGHTTPHITFPVGGYGEISSGENIEIIIKKH